MPIPADLQAALDLLTKTDKASLQSFLDEANAFHDKIVALQGNMLPPSPSAPVSNFMDKAEKNLKGSIDEATMILGQFE